MSRGRDETVEVPHTYLVAHPWDTIGQPPEVGPNYVVENWEDQARRINELLKEAAGYAREAEDKREDADSDEDSAEECWNEAEEIVQKEIIGKDLTYAARVLKQIRARALKLE